MSRSIEHEHQVALFKWAAAQETAWPELRWLHSTQAGARVSPQIARRLKAEGMKSGPPDIFLDIPRGQFHGLRIELKRPKAPGVTPGRLSPEQVAWLDHYAQRGYFAAACWGWHKAAETITSYLDLPSP
jgi:hypothetical protein